MDYTSKIVLMLLFLLSCNGYKHKENFDAKSLDYQLKLVDTTRLVYDFRIVNNSESDFLLVDKLIEKFDGYSQVFPHRWSSYIIKDGNCDLMSVTISDGEVLTDTITSESFRDYKFLASSVLSENDNIVFCYFGIRRISLDKIETMHPLVLMVEDGEFIQLESDASFNLIESCSMIPNK